MYQGDIASSKREMSQASRFLKNHEGLIKNLRDKNQ